MFRISNRERTGKITHVSGLMKAIISAYDLAKPFSVSAIRESWKEIAGSIATMTYPEKFEHDILYIAAEHSAAANEIIMLKGVIMKRFTESFGQNLKDVRTVIKRGVNNNRGHAR